MQMPKEANRRRRRRPPNSVDRIKKKLLQQQQMESRHATQCVYVCVCTLSTKKVQIHSLVRLYTFTRYPVGPAHPSFTTLLYPSPYVHHISHIKLDYQFSFFLLMWFFFLFKCSRYNLAALLVCVCQCVASPMT